MAVKASSYRLNIWCQKHPEYRGIRPSVCDSCFVIFCLMHSNSRDIALSRILSAKKVLNALKDLVVKSENTPTAIKLTRQRQSSGIIHFVNCPAHPVNQLPGKSANCTCAFLSSE